MKTGLVTSCPAHLDLALAIIIVVEKCQNKLSRCTNSFFFAILSAVLTKHKGTPYFTEGVPLLELQNHGGNYA